MRLALTLALALPCHLTRQNSLGVFKGGCNRRSAIGPVASQHASRAACTMQVVAPPARACARPSVRHSVPLPAPPPSNAHRFTSPKGADQPLPNRVWVQLVLGGKAVGRVAGVVMAPSSLLDDLCSEVRSQNPSLAQLDASLFYVSTKLDPKDEAAQLSPEKRVEDALTDEKPGYACGSPLYVHAPVGQVRRPAPPASARLAPRMRRTHIPLRSVDELLPTSQTSPRRTARIVMQVAEPPARASARPSVHHPVPLPAPPPSTAHRLSSPKNSWKKADQPPAQQRVWVQVVRGEKAVGRAAGVFMANSSLVDDVLSQVWSQSPSLAEIPSLLRARIGLGLASVDKEKGNPSTWFDFVLEERDQFWPQSSASFPLSESPTCALTARQQTGIPMLEREEPAGKVMNLLHARYIAFQENQDTCTENVRISRERAPHICVVAPPGFGKSRFLNAFAQPYNPSREEAGDYPSDRNAALKWSALDRLCETAGVLFTEDFAKMLKQAKVVSVTFNNDMDRAHDNRTSCNISDADQALAVRILYSHFVRGPELRSAGTEAEYRQFCHRFVTKFTELPSVGQALDLVLRDLDQSKNTLGQHVLLLVDELILSGGPRDILDGLSEVNDANRRVHAVFSTVSSDKVTAELSRTKREPQVVKLELLRDVYKVAEAYNTQKDSKNRWYPVPCSFTDGKKLAIEQFLSATAGWPRYLEQSLFAIDAVVERGGGALSWVEYLNELLAKLERQPVYGRCTRMHASAEYQNAIKYAYLSDKIAWDEQSSEAQEVRQEVRQLAEKGLLAIDESPETAPLMPRVCIPLMEQLLAQRDLANEPNTANRMLCTLLAAVKESAFLGIPANLDGGDFEYRVAYMLQARIAAMCMGGYWGYDTPISTMDLLSGGGETPPVTFLNGMDKDNTDMDAQAGSWRKEIRPASSYVHEYRKTLDGFQRSLKNGRVLFPENQVNPGWDFLMVQEDGESGLFLWVVEVKHAKQHPNRQALSLKTLEQKIRATLKSHDWLVPYFESNQACYLIVARNRITPELTAPGALGNLTGSQRLVAQNTMVVYGQNVEALLGAALSGRHQDVQYLPGSEKAEHWRRKGNKQAGGAHGGDDERENIDGEAPPAQEDEEA